MFMGIHQSANLKMNLLSVTVPNMLYQFEACLVKKSSMLESWMYWKSPFFCKVLIFCYYETTVKFHDFNFLGNILFLEVCKHLRTVCNILNRMKKNENLKLENLQKNSTFTVFEHLLVMKEVEQKFLELAYLLKYFTQFNDVQANTTVYCSTCCNFFRKNFIFTNYLDYDIWSKNA